MSKFDLSEMEYEIMKYFWKENRLLTSREVTQHFNENGHQWALQTVLTFLNRLVNKNALQVRRQGKRLLFQAAMTPAQYSGQFLKNTIAESFDGSVEDFFVALREMKTEFTEEQIAELRKIWDE